MRGFLAELHLANQGERQGVFFVVNPGGHRDDEIAGVAAHFVEADELSLEAQYANLQGFPLAPSVIVKTRKSLHGYWLINDGQRSDFAAVQKALASVFDGDPVISNLSRVMRLPGFDHNKAAPVLVTCLKFDPQLRYTQGELLGALPGKYPVKKPPLRFRGCPSPVRPSTPGG